MLWNVIWWAAYLAIGLWWARHEIVTKTVIGTIWAQAPPILLLEFRMTSALAWSVAVVWLSLVYWHIYKQAILMNRAMDLDAPGMHASRSP